MRPEKIDWHSGDVKPRMLELLRQNSELTARVDRPIHDDPSAVDQHDLHRLRRCPGV